MSQRTFPRDYFAVDRGVTRATHACPDTVCARCASHPDAHSVYRRGETTDKLPIIFTQPAEASAYSDHVGICAHFTALADTHHPAKWVWVFDADGLQLKHVVDPRTGVRLAVLLARRYHDSCEAIAILNANAVVRWSLYVVTPFLGRSMHRRIHVFSREDEAARAG